MSEYLTLRRGAKLRRETEDGTWVRCCKQCEQWLPEATRFYRNPGSGVLDPRCHACRSSYQRRDNARHRKAQEPFHGTAKIVREPGEAPIMPTLAQLLGAV